MATVSNGSAATGGSLAGDPLAVGTWGGGGESDSKSDRYLAQRLAAASADYKGVALTTFLLGAGVGGFVWLACGILIEHWLLPGGLPRSARWAWLALGAAALVAGIIRWVVPLLRYRVNLVYAARAIEREHPELHNDLVNTVLVKAHPEASPPLVLQSLERRTAKRLSGMPAEAVVDRTTALRLAYVLAALVGLACVYEVAAPKSLAVTAARLLAPWISWAAPSRVRIEPLKLAWRMPGEKDGNPAAAGDLERRRIAVDSAAATLVRGRQLVVSAGMRGLRRDEEPLVTVTPLQAGAGAASWQAKMVRGESAAGLPEPNGAGASKQFVVVLPDSVRGLDHAVEIVIAAGDARSEPVRIAVVDSPSLLVREIRYDYPAYTGKQSEAVEWQGDIRAVEGTQVTIVAESNQPLEDAWIDFDCDGDHDLKFTKNANDLARVTKSFELQMNADRSGPQHAIYRLCFLPRAVTGLARELEVTEPMEHRIEVIADLAPEVSIEEPRESPARVPPAAAVAVRVRALDPDFALARVGIETRLQGGPAHPEITLLAEEKTGVFKGLVRLVPERLGAGPGSVLEYRAVAVDTRPKTPNVSHSPWQSLQIDASAKPRPQNDPAPRSGGQQGDRAGEAAEQESGRGAAGGEEQSGQQEPATDAQPDAPAGTQSTAPPQEQQPQEPPSERQKQQEKRQQEKQGQEEQGQEEQAPQNGQQGEPNQGQQSGGAEGGEQGGKQQTPGESQRGDKQGAGKNEGQGANQGQGTGAQGKRSDGQPSGKQQSEGGGGENAGGKNTGGKESGGSKDGNGQQSSAKKPADASEGQRGGKQPPNPAVASDGTNDGEAMERILNHRRQAGDTEKSGGEKSGGEKSGGEKSGGEKSGGEKSGGEKSGGEKQSQSAEGGQPKPQNNTAPNQNQSQCTDADGKPCGKESCSNCSGGGKPGNGGGQQSGGEQAGKDAGGKDAGAGERSGDQTGDEKNGAGKSGAGAEPGSEAGKSAGNKGKGGADAGGKGEPAADAGQPQTGEQSQGEPGQGQQPAQGPQGSQQEQQQGKPSQQAGEAGKGEPANQREQAGKGGERRDNGTSQKGQQQAPGAAEQAGSENTPNTESSDSGAGRGPDGKQVPPGSPQSAAGKPSAASSETGSGGWSGGDGPQQPRKPLADGPAPAKETEWGEQDLAHARNAANLAVEHLRNAVESDRKDVLDQLGWTREQARAFLDRWEKMRSLADSGDPVQRGEFERAVRSLGLRPDGVRSSRDVPSDVQGGQSEGRRSRPPTDYREQFKAYTQGTAGE